MNTACSNRTEHTERTRQEILHAALRLFATRGYAGTSTQVIVKTAQVAKPVLYYHFGNKAGLFQAVIDEIDNRLLGLILASEAEAANAPGQLVAICAAVFRFTCDHPEVMELVVDLLLEARRQELPGKHSLGKAHQRLAVIRKIMGQGMREGTLRDQFNSRLLAVGFLGMIHFHVLFRLANPRYPLTRRTSEHAVTLFLAGAATGKSKNPCPTQTRHRKVPQANRSGYDEPK